MRDLPVRKVLTPALSQTSALRPQQNRLLLGAFDLDAMSLDAGIVFESLMDNPSVERAQGFELDDIPPAPDLLGGVFGLLDQRVTGLGTVATDIHHNFGRGWVLLEQQPVSNVLKIGKRLALAADKPAGILRIDVEQQSIFETMLLDIGGEAEQFKDLFQCNFGFSRHGFDRHLAFQRPLFPLFLRRRQDRSFGRADRLLDGPGQLRLGDGQ